MLIRQNVWRTALLRRPRLALGRDLLFLRQVPVFVSGDPLYIAG